MISKNIRQLRKNCRRQLYHTSRWSLICHHLLLCSDEIKVLEQELILIDEEIKSLKPDIPLDKANTRCKYKERNLLRNIVIKLTDEARRRMIQKIYEKDDASIANFCSHGQYRF